MAALKSILSSRVSKWMGQTISAVFLPDIIFFYSGCPRVGLCLSTERSTGASSTRHRRFPGAKGNRLHSSNTVAAEFAGSEPSRIWSVLHEKVYHPE